MVRPGRAGVVSAVRRAGRQRAPQRGAPRPFDCGHRSRSGRRAAGRSTESRPSDLDPTTTPRPSRDVARRMSAMATSRHRDPAPQRLPSLRRPSCTSPPQSSTRAVVAWPGSAAKVVARAPCITFEPGTSVSPDDLGPRACPHLQRARGRTARRVVTTPRPSPQLFAGLSLGACAYAGRVSCQVSEPQLAVGRPRRRSSHLATTLASHGVSVEGWKAPTSATVDSPRRRRGGSPGASRGGA
jgi:hypothetical protein